MQISLFNCVIGIRFKINSVEERTNYIINTIYMIAEKLSAFILYPDMSLYHSDGRLLISIEGNTDFEEFYPISSSDILDKDIKESKSDIERKERSFKILDKKGIPYIEHLKAAGLEEDTNLQTKEDIIKRMTAVFAACVQSEVYTCKRYKDVDKKTKEELAMLEERYGIFDNFSSEEREYIKNPLKELHNKFGWRYECCAVFMWALSLLELQEPDNICSASELSNIIWNNTFESLMQKSKLRSKAEILDLYDLVLRYDWACVDARVNNKKVDCLNQGVIYNWHYALNWLLKVDGIYEWDEIITNT